MSMTPVVTDPHKSDRHMHETHGHKTSSENGEKREEEGGREKKISLLLRKYTSHSCWVFSVMIVSFQSPITLRDTFMRLVATKQEPHLSMGRKGRRRSTETEKLKGVVSLLYIVATMLQ